MSEGEQAAGVFSAPVEVAFDYTRSLGPTMSRFFSALRERRIEGVRGSDGRVHCPPPEYDPVTSEPLGDFVDVGTEGEVVTWSWMPDPLEGQPLDRPFAWALVRLDSADTPMLHAVDVNGPSAMRTGMRVRARFTDAGEGIRAIECFEPIPVPAKETRVTDGEVTREGQEEEGVIVTPIRLDYQYSVSESETRFLTEIEQGRILGQRCPVCSKVYVPARGSCPTDGVFLGEFVALADRGIVTTFCVVNVPFLGQKIEPPYVAAYVLLEGADIAFQHLILGCPADEVRMGMRVEAVWKPREEWTTSLENIDHFRPTGEPDAEFESYAGHL